MHRLARLDSLALQQIDENLNHVRTLLLGGEKHADRARSAERARECTYRHN